VPEVPRLTTTVPGCVAPEPIALIMLSPPPAETSVPSARPNRAEPAALTRPAGDPASSRLGTRSARAGSTASMADGSNARATGSNHPVPEASPASMEATPVRRRLR